MSADVTTVKKLYGFSYNECAYPNCSQRLVEIDSTTGKAVNYGELVHIHGQKPGAERFLQDVYNDKDRLHGFENILILCARHHHQVDQPGAGAHYNADMLREWKMQHIQNRLVTELDREWIYGGKTLVFNQDGKNLSLSYWITEQGELRFHTPEQLAQCDAARDLALLFSQMSSITSILDQASGEPANSSHQTENDGYMRILKQRSGELKHSWIKRPVGNQYESMMHRIHDNLTQCPDITLTELSEIGTEKGVMKTTLIVGNATSERITATLEQVRFDARRVED